MLDISIVTITFNNFEELLATLNSTEGLECERVVVNGGTCKRTKEFLQSRTDIVSLSERDDGISDAFNKGITLASRGNVWILNSGDTLINPDFVVWAAGELKSKDFVYAKIEQELRSGKTEIYDPRPGHPLGYGMPYLHPSMILRKEIYNNIGMYDVSFKIAMDFDLVCRMQEQNYQTSYYPHPVVLMDGSGVSSTKPFRTQLELAKALLKNRHPLQLIAIFPIRIVHLFFRASLFKLGFGPVYNTFRSKLKNS